MGHTELNLDERRTFYRLREAKLPMAEIARVMGRHRSSLYREVKRNCHQDQEVPAASGYFPVTAQSMAEGRRRRQCKLIRLHALIESQQCVASTSKPHCTLSFLMAIKGRQRMRTEMSDYINKNVIV